MIVKKLISKVIQILTQKREYLTIREDGTIGVFFKKN